MHIFEKVLSLISPNTFIPEKPHINVAVRSLWKLPLIILVILSVIFRLIS